jgi:CheY-like chemotaxis protein
METKQYCCNDKERPDVIFFMDIQMPNKTVMKSTDEIRKFENSQIFL